MHANGQIHAYWLGFRLMNLMQDSGLRLNKLKTDLVDGMKDSESEDWLWDDRGTCDNTPVRWFDAFCPPSHKCCPLLSSLWKELHPSWRLHGGWGWCQWARAGLFHLMSTDCCCSLACSLGIPSCCTDNMECKICMYSIFSFLFIKSNNDADDPSNKHCSYIEICVLFLCVTELHCCKKTKTFFTLLPWTQSLYFIFNSSYTILLL